MYFYRNIKTRQIMRTALLSFGLLLCIGISACNGDDDKPKPTLAGGTMSAQIDGTAWAATSTDFFLLGGELEFAGYRSPTNQPTIIDVYINGYNGVNEYILNTGGNKAFYLSENRYYRATSGKVNVTLDDAEHLMATFQFDATDTATGSIRAITGSYTYTK
jgi:hypothetical protein